MPLKTDRSDLPRQVDGVAPDPEPRYLPHIIETWLAEFNRQRDEARGQGSGSVLWASDAGQCARRIGYDIRHRRGELDLSNPFTVADEFRFAMGSLVHSVLEGAIEQAFPGSQAEVRGSFDVPALTFRADGLIVTPEGKRVACEWKSCGGFAYKRMATSGRSPAEGPRLSAFLQGAIAATRLECDELVVGYVALELLSPAETKRQNMSETGRFCSEWSYTPDEFRPVAEAELARLHAIMQCVDEGELPQRIIPGYPAGMIVTNPATGQWEVHSEDNGYILNSGTAYECNYCSHQGTCLGDL